jgi:hypothetical protein
VIKYVGNYSRIKMLTLENGEVFVAFQLCEQRKGERLFASLATIID